MRRLAILLAIVMILPIAAMAFEPERTVDISIERKLTSYDLELMGEKYLLMLKMPIFGEDGYAHLLSAKDADDESKDVRLEKETDFALNDATWHPGGKSALIVGDSGTVLRFNSTNFCFRRS